jgi:hypothetical protein
MGSENARYGALLMRKTTPIIAVLAASLLATNGICAAGLDRTESRFTFKNSDGKTESVPVISKFLSKKIQHPVATVDQSLDPKLLKAATIAQERANAHSRSQCWRFVKQALVAAGIISSYPKTTYAKQAGQELVNNYGFKKLPVGNPFQAPVGSVLVYGGKAAGHVEIRTKDGFASDFRSRIPSPRPLLGVFAKS